MGYLILQLGVLLSLPGWPQDVDTRQLIQTSALQLVVGNQVKLLIFYFSCIVNDHGQTIWYICNFQEEIVLENIMFVIAKLANSSSRIWPGVGKKILQMCFFLLMNLKFYKWHGSVVFIISHSALQLWNIHSNHCTEESELCWLQVGHSQT